MNALYMIRHSLTEGNERRLYYGATDLPLSENGRALCRSLRGTIELPEGVLYATSGMLRAEETLQLLIGSVAHEILPDLREMEMGAFEMHSYDELKGRAAYQAWLAGDMAENHTPGGESEREVQQRVLRALAALRAQKRDVLAVVHGGTIVHIMQALFPGEGKNRYEWQPKPGFGYEIDMNILQYRMIPE